MPWVAGLVAALVLSQGAALALRLESLEVRAHDSAEAVSKPVAAGRVTPSEKLERPANASERTAGDSRRASSTHSQRVRSQNASDEAGRHSAKVRSETAQQNPSKKANEQEVEQALRKEKASNVTTQVAAVRTEAETHQAALDGIANSLRDIGKKLQDAEEEVKNKKQEEQVQSELAQEKMQAAAKEQAQVDELKNTAQKLQKEAEVASEIAKEKADAAVKSKKEEKIAESKINDLLAESKETQKFLIQTRREEANLQANISTYTKTMQELVKSEAAAKKKAAIEHQRKAEGEARRAQKEAEDARHEVETLDSKALESVAQVEQGQRLKAEGLPAQAKPSVVVGKASASPATPAVDADEVKRLLEENEELKKEKQELEEKLQEKNVAQEKDLLRQKFKDKLAKADRTSKATGKRK